MYPQSLHTHSPCQNWAALSASSAFCASVLRFPNTFREVGATADRGATRVRGVAGANANAELANRQIAEMIAMILFMVYLGVVLLDDTVRFGGVVDDQCKQGCLFC